MSKIQRTNRYLEFRTCAIAIQDPRERYKKIKIYRRNLQDEVILKKGKEYNAFFGELRWVTLLVHTIFHMRIGINI